MNKNSQIYIGTSQSLEKFISEQNFYWSWSKKRVGDRRSRMRERERDPKIGGERKPIRQGRGKKRAMKFVHIL